MENPAVVYSYAAYLFLSVALTIWVAHTLFKNGRVFLVDAFRGNAPLADSVNHLLVVGFYLINVGYICYTLSSGVKPTTLVSAIEFDSTKVGLVLFILGGMHFGNLFIFSSMRAHALDRAGLATLPIPKPETKP